MVKIAVCDDEKGLTARLKIMLADFFGRMAVEHEIDEFFSGSDLCRVFEAGVRYSLIFLDIAFPGDEVDGVEVGRRIREVHNDLVVSIVFISWEKRYSLQLHKIHPLDFLVKPLTCEKVEEVVGTYLKILAQLGGGGTFAYRKGHTTCSMPMKDIVYLEVRNRKIIIHMCDGAKDEFYGVLRDVYDEQLRECGFLFLHASYVVNFDHVTAIGSGGMHVAGRSTPLPISQSRRNKVRGQYALLSFRRGCV